MDVSSVMTVVGAAGAAVGSVGGAVLGVKALTSSFKYYRETLGYSVPAAMRQARKDYDAQASGVTAAGRQMEKDYEAMWAEQSKGKR